MSTNPPPSLCVSSLMEERGVSTYFSTKSFISLIFFLFYFIFIFRKGVPPSFPRSPPHFRPKIKVSVNKEKKKILEYFIQFSQPVKNCNNLFKSFEIFIKFAIFQRYFVKNCETSQGSASSRSLPHLRLVHS